MRLKDLEMIELMPNFMKEDKTVKALCKSISKMIRDVSEKIDTLSVWNAIDLMSSGSLDELAWELDIDWWETSWSLQEKRNTIRTAFKILDKRGTKKAVVHAISNAFGSGYVEEWFEYGGEPYYFIAGTEEILTEENIDKFMKLVEISKNKRSRLDTIATVREVKAYAYVGTTVYETSEIEVY